MVNFQLLPWRNRLIAGFPLVTRLSELRHLYQTSRAWKQDGWSTPVPYFVRRAMLISEGRSIGAKTLVETGTFLGDTTWSLKSHFKHLHSIEVEPGLAGFARKRFLHHPHVAIHEGDSAALLAGVCETIQTNCLFYLDGHYSGGFTGMGTKECPIIEELGAIFNHTSHPFKIIIDDARLFGSHPAYPDISVIHDFLLTQKIKTSIRIENDAIIISQA